MQNDSSMEHRVTLDEAASMTRAFRLTQTFGKLLGGSFSRPVIDTILAQPDCVGLRYYYALRPSGEPTLVLLGVDAAGNDLWRGELAEISRPCPPFCPVANPLNADR